MDKKQLNSAFESLSRCLAVPTRVIIGGGAAMVAAYDIHLSTQDVDGVPDRTSMELSDFKEAVRAVGRELKISQDWLNDYFSTFLFVLPSDYGDRLVSIYKGDFLEVCALGKEELILMKCFANREKDILHARVLIRKGANLKIVDQRIQELIEKNIPGATKAADLFDDLCDEMGVAP